MTLKIFVIGFLFLLLGGSTVFLYNQSPGVSELSQPMPCASELTYKFGEIDPRLDINQQQLAEVMNQVETLWSTAINKQLLTYSKDGQVKINLTYGKHQKKTEDAKNLYQQIQVKKRMRGIMEKEYQRLAESYERKHDSLQHTLSEFETLIENYHTTIARWNEKGGVPISEKENILAMQRAVENKKVQVDRQKQAEESLRKRVNEKGEHYNALVEQENSLVKTYKNRFGKAQKFNQGRYAKTGDRESITIYQFGNLAELKTVLAHEAGHALGLRHVKNPASVMFEMRAKQDIFDLKLSQEDIAAIKNQCDR